MYIFHTYWNRAKTLIVHDFDEEFFFDYKYKQMTKSKIKNKTEVIYLLIRIYLHDASLEKISKKALHRREQMAQSVMNFNF